MGTLNIPNTFTAGSTINASQMNANFNAVKTVANGNIEAINIKDATLTSDKFAAGLLAQSFMYNIFNTSFVGSGLMATDSSTGGTPKVTVSAGVIYTVASGELVQYSKSSDTYSFSGDSAGIYLFISSAGVLSASGVITPVAGTQLLAKCVVTGFGGTAAVAITDYARRGFNKPKEMDGLELEYVDGDTVKVSAGYSKIAGIDYRLPAITTVEFATAGNWIGGSVGLTNASKWVYVYVTGTDTWLSVKLSATAPAFFDEYGNQVTSHFPNKWHYASAVPYRCIGAVYATDNNTAFTAIERFWQRGNAMYFHTFTSVACLIYSGYASGTNPEYEATTRIPAISKTVILSIYQNCVNTSTINELSIRTLDSGAYCYRSACNYQYLADTNQITIPTSDTQTIRLTIAGVVSSADYCEVYTEGFIMAIRD